MRRLAKAAAVLRDKTMALYLNEDGTYSFDTETDKQIIEYISPY